MDDFNHPSPMNTRKPVKSGSSTFKEKVGFPSAKLPGKTQGKNRSNGIKRIRAHPKSLGL